MAITEWVSQNTGNPEYPESIDANDIVDVMFEPDHKDYLIGGVPSTIRMGQKARIWDWSKVIAYRHSGK